MFICDDLISVAPIDRHLVEKILESPNVKVISGTFGKFNINDLPECFRKRIELEKDMDWESLYKQESFESKGKPYRCICNSLDIRFGSIIDLELSPTRDGMVLVKSVCRNLFKKIYKNYGDFLKEWEKIE